MSQRQLQTSRRHNLQYPRADHAGSRRGLESNKSLPDGFGAGGGKVSQVNEATPANFDKGRQPAPAQLSA